MLGLDLMSIATRGKAVPWTPARLATGCWIDPSDPSTLRQERTGASATTAVAVGDYVGSVYDKLRGGWWTAPTNSARPRLLQNASGYRYLQLDGVDDCLVYGAPAIGLTNLIIMAACAETTHTDNYGIVVLASATGGDFDSADAIYLATSEPWAAGLAVGALVNGTPSLRCGYNATNPQPLGVYEVYKTAAMAAGCFNGTVGQTDTSIPALSSANGGDAFVGCRYYNGSRRAYYPGSIYQVVITNDDAAIRPGLRKYVAGKAGIAL
jgi:hypothetical protein